MLIAKFKETAIMKRLALVSLVLLPLMVAFVLLNNALTNQRLMKRRAALEAVVAKAGLIGKSQSDVKSFLTTHGLSYHEDEWQMGGPTFIIIGETEELGWTLTPVTAHAIWSVSVVFEFDKNRKRVVSYHVDKGMEWGLIELP